MPDHPDVAFPLVNHPEYKPIWIRAQAENCSPTVIKKIEHAILMAPTVEDAVVAGNAVIDEAKNV